MTRPVVTVAVLGTGTMGAPMARNLLHAGFNVRVWNRTLAKAAVVGVDARRTSTPGDAAAGADVLITMLADGAAVEQVDDRPDRCAVDASSGGDLDPDEHGRCRMD